MQPTLSSFGVTLFYVENKKNEFVLVNRQYFMFLEEGRECMIPLLNGKKKPWSTWFSCYTNTPKRSTPPIWDLPTCLEVWRGIKIDRFGYGLELSIRLIKWSCSSLLERKCYSFGLLCGGFKPWTDKLIYYSCM